MLGLSSSVDYGAISTTAAEPQHVAAAGTGAGSSDAGTAAAAGLLVETAEPLRAELQGLRVMALHSRAASEGVDPVAIEDAMDSETPKDDLIALLIIQEARTTSAAAEAEKAKEAQLLRSELEGMKVMALHARAMQMAQEQQDGGGGGGGGGGGSGDGGMEEMLESAVDGAMDGDNPKRQLVELLLPLLLARSA